MADMPRVPLRLVWLFSPMQDLLAFFAPLLLALVLSAVWGTQAGASLSPLGWLLVVVCVDVAHVWATLYRVYTESAELHRRLRLYLLLPLGAYGVGVGLHAHASLTFWRVLAYLAVFHFVRQQVGWVALVSRRQAPLSSLRWMAWDRRFDALAVYLGTLYPVLHWHAHLPRRFHWFIDGDFLSGLPPQVLPIVRGLWLVVGTLWLLRQGLWLFHPRHPSVPVTKLLVMGTTWVGWYVGIVAWDSDVVFTLTNVLPHGLPYFVLLFRYWQRAPHRPTPAPQVATPMRAILGRVALFMAPLLLLAWLEEGLWDRLIWHDHPELFLLPARTLSAVAQTLLVPLLALPQATHYLLDAWIWRVGPQNPALRQRLGFSADPA